jgi:hypothetical protein
VERLIYHETWSDLGAVTATNGSSTTRSCEAKMMRSRTELRTILVNFADIFIINRGDAIDHGNVANSVAVGRW